jgi:hypothetical protein
MPELPLRYLGCQNVFSDPADLLRLNSRFVLVAGFAGIRLPRHLQPAHFRLIYGINERMIRKTNERIAKS